MSGLMFLIDQLALGLYVLLGVSMVWAWWNLGAAQRDYRETYFELERGLARYRRANAITSLVLLVEVALVVMGIQQVVVPTIEAQDEQIEQVMAPVAEDGTFSTPTPQMREDTAIDDSEVRELIDATQPFEAIQATPTLTPTPVGTILPNPGEVVGCDTDNAMLEVPANGMLVFTPIDVRGTAYVDDFAFYRFELRGESTQGQFAPLADYTESVQELTSLGQFTPTFHTPGEYQFRLNVFDVAGAVQATCTVNIVISEPIPTRTPLPSNAG